jgi:hypothetical protein
MYNFEGDLLLFTVQGQDAEYTFDILMSAGVPVENYPAWTS